MWLVLGTAAFAGDAMVAIEVQQPSDAVPLVVEQAVPWKNTWTTNLDGRTYATTVSVGLHEDGLSVRTEVALRKGRKNKVLAEHSGILAAGEPLAVELVVEAPRSASVRQYTWKTGIEWTPVVLPPTLEASLPEDWPQRRYVLVWDDANLKTEIQSGKGEEKVRATLEAGHTTAWQSVSPYRVVGPIRHGYYEVESVPQLLAPHCYTDTAPIESYPFQYFIRDEETLKVTTREVEIDRGDGTGAILAAGVALTPATDGRWKVHVAGASFVAELPSDAVGDWYTPTRHFDSPGSGQVLQPEGGLLGELGGAPVRGVEGAALPVHGRTGVRDAVVTSRTACAELRLKASGSFGTE